MHFDHRIVADKDGAEWAIHSENWLIENSKPASRQRLRDRRIEPLILCGHGVALRIENGALVIRDGLTHFPQEKATYRFFPGDRTLPPRIILLDGSGTLSFDVLSWLGEQRVALVRIKWGGEIAVVASASGYACDPAKSEWQRITRDDETARLKFSAELIRQKLEASIDTLRRHFPDDAMRGKAINCASVGIERLEYQTHRDMNSIYAIEGECAVAYFKAWRAIEMRWLGLDRKPVPEEWHTFKSRASLLSGKSPKNRLASHPINAMLNYAYTVRQSKLQIDAIVEGFDPTIGIMHNRHQGSSAYILDMIEPERPKIDAAILDFIANRSFAFADFIIQRDGVCRLSPQLARTVATLAM